VADDSTDTTTPVDVNALAQQFADGVFTRLISANWDTAVTTTLTKAFGESRALVWKSILTIAGLLGELLANLEEPMGAAIAPFIAPTLAGIFGANVDPSTFTRRIGSGGGLGAAQSIVDGLVSAITGGAAGEVAPSSAGTKRLASAAVAASLESNFNAILFEVLSDAIPFEIGHFQSIAELPEGIIRALGVGRLVRQALRPIVNASCEIPAQWDAYKTYRPTLLGPGVVCKQWARDRITSDAAAEILARHGYADKDHEALYNDALKSIGLAELYYLVRASEYSLDDAVAALKDQGYDEGTARLALDVEKIKIIATFEEELAVLAVDAYAAGRIDEGTLDGYTHGSTMTDQQGAQYRERATAKKALDAKPITGAEAAECVLAGVLAFPDYRDALTKENRTPDAIDALDLLLRYKFDKAKSLADHKQEAADAKAKAAADKLAAAQAKKAAQDQKVAQAKLGKPADIDQAYIRGIVPIDRVRAVLDPLYDADTVATLLATLEQKRTAFAQQQAARDKAVARAAARGIDVAQLEAAVKNGVVTIDQFHAQLLGLTFDAADADVITQTLAAELQKAADAKKLHAGATAAANSKHIDLATLELLVRRGHRTIADFNATIKALGYDDTAIAALDDKLGIEIAADTAAAKVKAAAAARLADKTPTLQQQERAAVLGVISLDAFRAWLAQSGESVDAQVTINGIVSDERQAADAAAQRRAAADARRTAAQIPIATLAKAVRVGVLPIAAYTAALVARGYTPDNVALETDLLQQEIGQTAAGTAAHTAAGAAAKARGLSLSQLDAAVKDGKLSIAAYTQRIEALGLSPADAALVASVVADQAAVAQIAAAKHQQIAGDAASHGVSLAELETFTLEGQLTEDQFTARLAALKYAPEDIALLLGELQQKAAKLASAGSRAASLAASDPGKEAARADFEKAVGAGLKTIDDYAAYLTEAGYGADDVDLLVALEQQKLDAAAAKAGTAPPPPPAAPPPP
jgi:hypothetical protein